MESYAAGETTPPLIEETGTPTARSTQRKPSGGSGAPVDPTHRRVECGGGSPHPCGLGRVEGEHGIDPVGETLPGHAAHLDDGSFTAGVDQQVDLASSHSQVAPDHAAPVTGDEVAGQPLGRLTEEAAAIGHSRPDCSISSTLTSRKVSTLTRLRNRAGRYMSHTQASSSRTSK